MAGQYVIIEKMVEPDKSEQSDGQVMQFEEIISDMIKNGYITLHPLVITPILFDGNTIQLKYSQVMVTPKGYV